MLLRPRCVGIATLVLGAAVATAAPASAATLTYTVKVGSATTGPATLGTASSNISFFDPDAGISAIECGSLSTTLTTSLSTAAKAKNIAKLSDIRIAGCTTRDGTALNLTAKGSWAIAAVGATSSSGLTSLVVTKVQIQVKAPNGACSYLMKGSLPASYTNGGSLLFNFDTTHILTVSKYTSSGDNHCEIGNGQRIAPLASQTVTAVSPKGAFSITSN